MTDRIFWQFFWAMFAIFFLGSALYFGPDKEYGAWIIGISSGLGITLVYFIVIKIIESYKGEEI